MRIGPKAPPTVRRPNAFLGFKIDIKLAYRMVAGKDFSNRPTNITKILIIEDGKEVRNIIAKRLKRTFSSKFKRYPVSRLIKGQKTGKKLSFLEASTLEEIEWAQKHAKELKVDLILLDFDLSEATKDTDSKIDGLQITRELRKQGYQGWIISISANPDCRDDMVVMGADFGIIKGYVVDEMLELLSV